MMLNSLMIENMHFVQGIAPVADAFAGTVNSDIVSLEEWQNVLFIYWQGVGTTGTSTITIEACDDTSATNTTALAFRYRSNTTSDTFSAVTAATSAGFTTTAGSNHIYVCEVDADEVHAAGNYADPFVRMTAVESANDPVLGGILIIAGNPSHPGAPAWNSILS